jgi:hypothetical protein
MSMKGGMKERKVWNGRWRLSVKIRGKSGTAPRVWNRDRMQS